MFKKLGVDEASAIRCEPSKELCGKSKYKTEPVGVPLRVPIAVLQYLNENNITLQHVTDAAQKVCNLLIEEFEAQLVPMGLAVRFVEASFAERARQQMEELENESK